DDLFHDHRRFQAAQPRQLAENIVVELLISGLVPGDDAQQIVRGAEETMSFGDLRNACDRSIEVVDSVRPTKGRKSNDLETEAGFRRVDHPPEAADYAVLFQLSYSTLTAGDTQLHFASKLCKGNSPILLQDRKNFAVDRIHIKTLSGQQTVRANTREHLADKHE